MIEIHLNMEPVFYNAVNLINNGDYGKILKIKNKFPDWESAWKTLGKGSKIDPEKEWKKLGDLQIKLFLKEDQQYPKLLGEIPHSPFGIYVLGELPTDSSLFFAIVGTRKATPDGKTLAKKFAAELTKHGFVITSGLAFGVDAAAHDGCLGAKGKTVAVLANGLDRVYPKTNEALAKKIIGGGGAIISEYPLGAESLPYRFLERNRIVSGLSRGALIIEAPTRSGSLATARFALDQNRDVFVIPGPITHTNFFGSNQLIRAGAELVTSPEEILAAFDIETNNEKVRLSSFETEEERKILETLENAHEPLDVDKLAESTNLNISEVNRTVTFLIMKNAVKETGEGYVLYNK